MEQFQKNADDLTEEYFNCLKETIGCIDRLGRISRQLGDEEEGEIIVKKVTPENTELIIRLMKFGLFRANLFPILLRADENKAIEFLIDQYISNQSNYDDRVAGYSWGLKGFFYDIVELKGENFLIDLLKNKLTENGKLHDNRILKVFKSAIPSIPSLVVAKEMLAK